MRDRESTHHGSMGLSELNFVRSHSYRVLQGTNPILGQYLEEDIGRLEEQPIIPRMSKPMFAQNMREATRNKVLSLVELNQLFQELS